MLSAADRGLQRKAHRLHARPLDLSDKVLRALSFGRGLVNARDRSRWPLSCLLARSTSL